MSSSRQFVGDVEIIEVRDISAINDINIFVSGHIDLLIRETGVVSQVAPIFSSGALLVTVDPDYEEWASPVSPDTCT